jgi:glycosyltransferase involved in cell wall biosynthesis
MKIAYVIHQFDPKTFAGTEIYTYDLAREMARRGNRVCVIAMPHKLEKKRPWRASSENFKLIKIRNKLSHLQEFKEILSKEKPDILHFQHLQYFSPRVIEIAKELNIPRILHLHDYFYICKRIRLVTKKGNICQSARNCGGCLRHRKIWKKHINESVDLLLANSYFTRDTYIRNGISPYKILVNYYGMDISRISNLKHSRSKVIRFAFLGTVIKEKGVEVLIKTFNKISGKCTLEIWGRIDRYKNSLFKKIKSDKITLRGEYNHKTIGKILSRTDVVIIPSVWPEPWSIVKTEALGAGLMVLASKIGGIPEGILDADRAFFFKPNNTKELLEAVRCALTSRFSWQYWGKSRNSVKSIKDDAQKLEYLYKKIISRYVKLSLGKRYVVNSSEVLWYYRGQDIFITRKSKDCVFSYTLSGVSGRFWQLFTEFRPFEEITEVISKEYNKPKDTVKTDLMALMNHLLRERIIKEAIL